MTSPQASLRRLTDEQVRRVLARASEIDASGAASLSEDDVRQVALEAGISEVAVLQALREIDLKPTARDGSALAPSSIARRLGRFVRSVSTNRFVLSTGLLLGSIASFRSAPSPSGIDYGPVIGMVGLIGLSFVSAIRRDRAAAYVRECSMLWGSFIAGYLTSGALAGREDRVAEGAVVLLVYWVIAVVVGLGIQALKRGSPDALREHAATRAP